MELSKDLADLREHWLEAGRPPIISADGCALGDYSANVVSKTQDIGLGNETPVHPIVLKHVSYGALDDTRRAELQAAMTIATAQELEP
jgi:hypothetical protein